MRKFSAAAVLVLVAGALTLAASDPAQIAAAVRRAIYNKMTSHWKCTNLRVVVQNYSDSSKARQGWFRYIEVSADAIERRGVRLAPASVKAWDVHLDLPTLLNRGKLVCYYRSKTHYYCKLSEADLNRALRLKKNMPIKNVHAYLRDGRIIFTGIYHLAMGHKIRLEGKLVPKNKYQVHFVPTRASVNGVPIPAGPLRVLLRKLNPLLDLRDVPLKPEVKSVVIKRGYLTVSG